MKISILTALLLTLGVAANAATHAELRFDPHRVNISSVPVTVVVTIATHTPTQVDATKTPGSFVAMVQNWSTENDMCCGFTSDFSTTTAAGTNKCIRVEKNNGTWVVNRWWRDISIYCQSENLTTPQPAACVQGSAP